MKTNKAWTITKINFSHLKLVYIITGLAVLAGGYNLFEFLTYEYRPHIEFVDCANYVYLAVILAAVFIPAVNFKRIMHLNGKRLGFYWGALLNYVMIAATASLLNIVLFELFQSLFGSKLVIYNLIEIFGWINHGVLLAFFQQFFFLLLLAVAIHTFTSMQTFRIGWAVDIAIIAVISVFTPIPMLRGALIWFFDTIIYQDVAVQIISCIVLTAGLYALYLPILQRKTI